MAREKTIEDNYVLRGASLLILKTLIENLRPVMYRYGGYVFVLACKNCSE